MTAPASPSSPPPQQPLNPNAPAVVALPSPLKKPQPLPWSHQETLNLILAYQDKWYSLKRGQLKANQWQEVADAVAARCGYGQPSKTATQCRHKMEKLRKRYRTEKQRFGSSSSPWQFFNLMDQMEHGPLPISARPITAVEYRHDSDNHDDEEDESSEHEVREDSDAYKSRSMNRGDRRCNGGISRFLRKPMFRKPRKVFDADWSEEEKEEEAKEVEDGGGAGRGAICELAIEMRTFAERYLRVENMRVEVMRETERFRMEMEDKRLEMILQSHRQIVDTIGRALGSKKKKKLKMNHHI